MLAIWPFWPCFFGLIFFFFMFIPSTIIFSSAGITLATLPVLPLSLPAIIFTISPFFIFIKFLHHFRRQRNYLVISPFLDFSRNRPEDSSAQRFVFGFVQKHDGVLVKSDIRPVFSSESVFLPDDESVMDFFLLDRFSRFSRLYGNDDNLAQLGVSFFAPAEHLENLRQFRAGIVGNIHHCSGLYHKLNFGQNFKMFVF